MYRLLIVDDEMIEREALRFIIKGSGINIEEIQEASNGQEAISVATLFKPQIIILDVKMPGLNGVEAAKILKRIDPDVKIIFLTAYNEFEIAHEAIKLHVEDFIVKPASNERVIEVLTKVITQIQSQEKMKHQRKNMEEKLSQISKYLESEFLSSVVIGEIDEQQAMDYMNFMSIDFHYGFGVAILIDYYGENQLSHLQFNMLKKRFIEKLVTAIQKRNIPFLLNHVRNAIYILVYGYNQQHREFYVKMLEEDFYHERGFIEEQLQAQVNIGIGNEYNNISELWKSFSQAKVACKNKMALFEESTDEINPKMDPLDFNEKKLCDSILDGNEKEMISIVDTILDKIIYVSNDINSIRLRLYEFFVLVNKALNNDSKLQSTIPEGLFNDLKLVDSKGQAKVYIHEYLFKLMEDIKKLKTDKTGLIFEEIIKYIDTHYAENLTLEEMAYKSGFSTYYFCKMFKKYSTCSFTDYLSAIRLGEAKRLLKDPHLNIKEITQLVGYVDPNYFTRVFKKHENMTPTEYRNKWILKKEERK